MKMCEGMQGAGKDFIFRTILCRALRYPIMESKTD